MAESAITVLIAEAHPTVGSALAAFLSDAPDIEVVGVAATGLETVLMLQELDPDVLVIDLELPDASATAVVAVARERGRRFHPVVLTAEYSESYVLDRLLAMGCIRLRRSQVPGEVLGAVHRAAAWRWGDREDGARPRC